MSGAATTQQLRMGFLEAMEVDGRGFVGGLLVTNQLGRPLEFQCTTPVRPNRTQEILYGHTLRSWVLGELIGGTLLDRISIKPDLIVTSDPCLLELRNHSDVPVACADDNLSSSAAESTTLSIGGKLLHFHSAHADDRDALIKQQHLIPDSANLTEPLDRVREALAETVKTVFAR
jgi:hypothetical protein